MKIGTPLSPNATKVMLLGSGELGKEVIIALQRLGVEVIAVDRYQNAPGHQVAHRAHVINMNNGDELRKLIELEQPDFVVPEIEAIATDMLLEIESTTNCTIIPKARATQLTMNREGIRRLAAEQLSIKTSNYEFAESLQELTDAINSKISYPCIIKPVMSSSGKGQSLINNADEIKPAWEYAKSGGRVQSTRVIIEQKIDFDFEITLLTVRALNSDNQIETYFCQAIGHRQINGDYVESWQPQVMSDVALQRSHDIAKKVTDNLQGQGLFGVELFIKGDDVWFSEISPRPHDTGMVTMISQRQNEFELHARAILGLPVDVSLLSPGASAVIYGAIDETAITYNHIEKALAVKNTDIRLFGKPEAFVKRRMGVALAHADNTDLARQYASESAALVTTSK